MPYVITTPHNAISSALPPASSSQPGVASSHPSAICSCFLTGRHSPASTSREPAMQRRWSLRERDLTTARAGEAANQLAEYFAGERFAFSLSISTGRN